jgi:surface protein
MRINEDYMDVIDRQDVANSVGDILDRQLKDDFFCHQIDVVLNTMKPVKLDFWEVSDAIYPVSDDNIKDVISKLSKLYMFSAGINLNWMDTSRVTNMYKLFSVVSTIVLDVDISRWDVSSVTNMGYMFAHKQFNGDISKWDVSSVRNMSCMFDTCSFNGNISGWNIRSLKSCQYMFADSDFNGDISGWDVSHINSMDRMFAGSKMYHDLSSWDVTNAAYKYEMFVLSPMQNIREWYPKGCLS